MAYFLPSPTRIYQAIIIQSSYVISSRESSVKSEGKRAHEHFQRVTFVEITESLALTQCTKGVKRAAIHRPHQQPWPVHFAGSKLANAWTAEDPDRVVLLLCHRPLTVPVTPISKYTFTTSRLSLLCDQHQVVSFLHLFISDCVCPSHSVYRDIWYYHIG